MPVMVYDIHNLEMTVFIYAPIWGNSGFFCTGVSKLMLLTDGGFSLRSFRALFSGLAVTAQFTSVYFLSAFVCIFFYAWTEQPDLIFCNTGAAHLCGCIIVNVYPVLIEILAQPLNWWPVVFKVNYFYVLLVIEIYMYSVGFRKENRVKVRFMVLDYVGHEKMGYRSWLLLLKWYGCVQIVKYVWLWWKYRVWILEWRQINVRIFWWKVICTSESV